MNKKNSGKLPDFTVNVWGGLNTSASNLDDLLPGETPDSLNWITNAAEKNGKSFGDSVELRRGTSILQETLTVGQNPVTGLAIGIKKDGSQVPVFSTGRSLFYYDEDTNQNIEIGTNTLPLLANNEDVAIVPYDNFSGYYVYFSSPSSSIYKISLSSPANIIDFNSFEYRGHISKNQSRLQLWDRQGLTSGSNLNDLFLSWADGTWAGLNTNPNAVPFTQKLKISKNATDGVTKTFTGTIAPDSPKQSLFSVQAAAPIQAGTAITAITKATGAVVSSTNHGLAVGDVTLITGVTGMTEINNLIGIVTQVNNANQFILNINSTSFTTYSANGTVYKCEYFIDDGDGLMYSQSGGTGTINYITGAYSLTFNTAPYTGLNIIFQYLLIGDYQNGIVDFTLAGGTQVANNSSVFSQPGLGPLMNVMSLSGINFCFHKFGVYQLGITDNDVTQASQQVYRLNAGIPYWRSAYSTGDGIIFLDTLDSTWPELRILTLKYSVSTVNPMIVPDSLSDKMNLSPYGWDQCVVFEWGDYYVLSGKDTKNGDIDPNNSLIFLLNKKTGNFDKTDLRANVLANYYGALISGDSISPNPLVLFSGFDDLGYNINNYRKSADLLLGWKGMKKFNRLVVKGLIQLSQNLEIWLSFNGGQYVKYATVNGNGQYVNQGVPVEIGGPVIGSNIVGGGGTESAYPFEAEFAIGSDLFERVSFMIKAAQGYDDNGNVIQGSGIGYVRVDEVTFKDIRIKSSRIINNFN